MKLVKSCRPEHNLKHGAALQIGTYSYYKKVGNEEIRDEQEATNTLTINVTERLVLPTGTFNAMSGPLIGIQPDLYPPSTELPNIASAHLQTMKIARSGGPFVELDEVRMTMRRELPNGFLFCMSMLEDHEEERIFDGYSDSWSIPIAHAGKFGQLICDHLAANFRKEWLVPQFGIDVSAANLNASRFLIHCQHQPVVYSSRDITVRSGNAADVEDALRKVGSMAFTKPEAFANDREYRFLFHFCLMNHEDRTRGRVYAPARDTLLLNLDIPWDEFA